MHATKIQILPLRRAPAPAKATPPKEKSPTSSNSSDSQATAVKHKRASKPKARTGCLTCKIRKIKCDEGRPNCLKCTSTGRKCDGYVPPPPRKARGQNQIALAREQSSAPTDGLALFPVEASSSELRALEYFCVEMAPNMGMHFDAKFWNRFVIPTSMAEPALRHAMVAVGIFAEQRDAIRNDDNAILQAGFASGHRKMRVPGRTSDGNAIVALSNYNKSISLLARLVSSSHKATDVVLLACILFICVELLRGDDEAAIRHFKAGMTIIVDTTSQTDCSFQRAPMIQRVKDSILPVFNRLEMLSALFGNDPSWTYPVTLPNSIPIVFSSVGQARDSMVHLMNLCLRFVRTVQLLEYEPSAIPASAYDEQTALLQYLQLWRSEFSIFQTNYAHELTPDDSYAANVLEIQRIVAFTWVSTVMNPYQCAHDAHIPAYTAAVVLAEQLSDFASARNKRARNASHFLIDVEVVGPIYWVCVKCREPAVRRRAIAVLRKMRQREGLWDSKIAAVVAERTVAIEEADVNGDELPSEEARVHGLSFASEKDTGPLSCLVTFQSKPFGVYEEWSVWQEQIPLGDG